MAAKPATLAAVAKLTKQTTALEAERKKIAKRVDTVRAIGTDAIKKSDYSRLGVVKTALDGDIKAVAASIATGKECVATLDTVKEDAEFVAERIRQDIDTQVELMRCRTLDEVLEVQSRFVNTAMDQYSAEATKLAQIGAEMIGAPRHCAAGSTSSGPPH